MYLARELTPLTLTEIARGFDRDHTTVLHAVRSVSARLEPGSETAETVHRVRAALGREQPDQSLKPTSPTPGPQRSGS
jgi:chromosomal replication initiator protein